MTDKARTVTPDSRAEDFWGDYSDDVQNVLKMCKTIVAQNPKGRSDVEIFDGAIEVVMDFGMKYKMSPAAFVLAIERHFSAARTAYSELTRIDYNTKPKKEGETHHE